jgi:predicted RNA-binding Zn-ribbon protein involved in translation (DUF1610 family)
MTQKDRVKEMLKAGKGYDEIEDQTGSARSYIRSIAVGYRKTEGEDKEEEKEEREPETYKKEHKETPGMNFLDDNTPKGEKPGKSGAAYHKEWVKAAKYECGVCGATIGRSTKFCPHCGELLVWEGIE